jgi:ABC-2 type transport system ATP-binding protein
MQPTGDSPLMTEGKPSAASSGPRDVLVAVGLRKSYGPRPALRGLSFSLKAGRLLGFLGPNGAGKTTSIRILTTILQPDSGRFAVEGVTHEYPDRIRRRIGVLPETFGLPRQMTAIEYVSFFGQLYGHSARDATERGLKLLDEVGLGRRTKSLIGTYSHGMRQRLGIARALVNDPAVVFLDEPTLGLDPRGQQELRELVQRIARERNAGVILCSHLLPEVEQVCDDVVILSAGEVVASGHVADVIGHAEEGVLRVRVDPAAVEASIRTLEGIRGVERVAAKGVDPGWLRVELDEGTRQDPAINNAILEALIRAEITVLSFEPQEGRLQDVFLQLTAAGIK